MLLALEINNMIAFTKAFNLIDHNILLSDLEKIGVRPALLPWLASYRSQRQQKVKFEGKLSHLRNINAGVPQGSKIGPFSFIAKINRLPDVAVTDQPIGIMELNIQRIATFCGEQRIVLNVRKTTIRSMKMYDSEVRS